MLSLLREIFRERSVSHEIGACLGVNFGKQSSATAVHVGHSAKIHLKRLLAQGRGQIMPGSIQFWNLRPRDTSLDLKGYLLTFSLVDCYSHHFLDLPRLHIAKSTSGANLLREDDSRLLPDYK
jgi:hypothetical protein